MNNNKKSNSINQPEQKKSDNENNYASDEHLTEEKTKAMNALLLTLLCPIVGIPKFIEYCEILDREKERKY